MDDNLQSRKVHTITNNRDTDVVKNGSSKLYSSKGKFLSKTKRNKPPETVGKKDKEIKPTESYWKDCGQRKPLSKSNESNNKEIEHHKPYNENEIKAYMTNKKRLAKEAANEKILEKIEKDKRIKMNLRTISENQHIRLTTSSESKKDTIKMTFPNLDKIEHSHKQMENKLQDDDSFSEESHQSIRTHTSTSESSERMYTPKNIVSAWQPLDNDIFESLVTNNRESVQRATSATRHTCGILNSIQMLSQKMELSRQDIMHFTAHGDMKITDGGRHLRPSSAELSDADSKSESTNEVSSSYRSLKDTKSNFVVQMTPKPQENRSRRKLSDDNTKINAKRLHVETSDTEDCFERLKEENQRRYVESLDNKPALSLPFNNYLSKPVAPVKPYRTEPPAHCDSKLFKDDPHRFIAIYKKSARQNITPSPKSPEVSKRSVDNGDVEKSVEKSHSYTHSPKASVSLNRVSDSLETKPSASMAIDAEDSESSELSKQKSFVKDSYSSSTIQQARVPSVADVSRKVRYTQEARLSPSSLERQFKAEIEYYDSLDVGFQQLLHADRLQGVAIAQQETASLAHLLKARQVQESQQRGTNDRLAIAIENMTRNFSTGSRKKRISYSTTSSTRTTSSAPSSGEKASRNRASTETDASEIEEEIVENISGSSITSKKENFQRPPVISNIKGNTERKDKIKKNVPEESEITENIENFTGYSDSEVEIGKSDSDCKSIKTVSTLKSVESALSVSYNKDLSPKEISTDRSVEAASTSPKTEKDISSTIKESISEVPSSRSVVSEYPSKSSSSEISVPTESIQKTSDHDVVNRSDSLKEISTVRSAASESVHSENSLRDNQLRHSEEEYSLNTFENSTTKSNKGVPIFGSSHTLTEQSDIEARISALIHEKNKKKDLVSRLMKDRSRTKNIRKEKALQDQIQLLNRHISTLENEIVQSDVTLSSISSIPLLTSKKKSRKKETNGQIMPNHSSKSSTSSSTSLVVSLSANEDNEKPLSQTSQDDNESLGADSSSTLISEKDATQSVDDQKSKGKAEEIDTPRSVKQLQFGDINEEYSASDHDSSEIRTPSEKSRPSKEVTDNGATKSKSERFHCLNLNGKETEDPVIDNLEDQQNAQDETGMLSARTIHSEISEIPDECVDISDQELEDLDIYNIEKEFRTEESEKDQESSFKDLYSDNFSDSSSHKVTKSHSKTVTDSEEMLPGDVQPQLEVSSESKEQLSPLIPPRRKEKPTDSSLYPIDPKFDNDEPPIDDVKNLEDYDGLIEAISQKELESFLQELFENVYENLAVNKAELAEVSSRPSFSLLIPWRDEHILPIVELAVESLFSARQARCGSTVSALDECLHRLPGELTSTAAAENETLKELEMLLVNRAAETTANHWGHRHINKMLICELVCDIVKSIFVLDDEEESSIWMKDAIKARRNKLVTLWRGADPPQSADRVAVIVRDELRRSNVLSSGEADRGMRRSRLHLWFIEQHKDRVDRILVDETIQDEGLWNMYENLEEEIIFHLTDQLLLEGIDDVVNG